MLGPTKCNGPRWCYLRSSGGVRSQTETNGALMVANNHAVAAAYPPPLVEVGRPPVAFAVKVTPMSGGLRWIPRRSRSRGQVAAWLVEVECPYGCKRPHTHGSGGPELLEFVGQRASHCGRSKSANDRGYYVVVPSSLVASAVAAVES